MSTNGGSTWTAFSNTLSNSFVGSPQNGAGAGHGIAINPSAHSPTAATLYAASPVSRGFVAKFNPSLTGTAALVYSTYLGGTNLDIGRAIAYNSGDFHAWLRRRAPKTRRYGSVCTGAFFLGASGLLEKKSTTTHWQHAAELAERFPAAKVVPDQIYVQDGALYTSAGVTAGIDLALKLIEDDHGRDLALTVARRLVVFLKRPGGQSQFSAHLAAQMADEGKIRSLQHWILDHLSLDLSLVSLASRVAMSVRNFTRVFQDETGSTPADFVEMARVDAARRLLEESETPLQRVASRCGFSSPDTMRRAFLRRIETGPSDYRERFRR